MMSSEPSSTMSMHKLSEISFSALPIVKLFRRLGLDRGELSIGCQSHLTVLKLQIIVNFITCPHLQIP